MTGPAAPGLATSDPAEPRATILELYRAVWSALRGAIVRYRVAIVVELVMIALWFALRSLVDVESRWYLAWTLVASAIAFVSPTSGLVILMTTVPFWEPAALTRALGMRNVLVVALGISVILRIVALGWRQLPRSPALILAIVVAVITAAGVAHTVRDFDPDFGVYAAQMWLTSTGGAMALLLVGAWVARKGEARPLVVAAIACAFAATLSIAELLSPGWVSNGPLGWIGYWKDFGIRISGIIPAPNAVATMLLVPATVAVAAILQFRGRRRIGAILVALPLVAGTVLTLSRSAIGALYIAVVTFVARRWRRTAVVLLVIGVVLAVVSIPLFLQLRAAGAGVVATQSPLDWLIGADEARVTAWGAAIRMWADSPIIGHGFLSYKQLADTFGDTRLGSPHNEVLRLLAEEGVIGGIALIAFIVALLRELAHRPGWIGAGVLAGVIGYWLAAMFNNPLLFIQVSATTFVFAGYALTAPVPKDPAGSDEPEVPDGSAPSWPST